MPENKTMRITGGSLVRRRFLIPKEVDDGIVRPTPDRVRESLFAMIKADCDNAVVLDIFAGSGAHGFEAISRGAKAVTFIEANKQIANTLKSNINHLALEDKCSLVIGDAQQFVSQPPKFKANIIFVDPPYSLSLEPKFFENLKGYLVDDGVVIYRCFKKSNMPFLSSFDIARDKIYGQTRVFILQKKSIL